MSLKSSKRGSSFKGSSNNSSKNSAFFSNESTCCQTMVTGSKFCCHSLNLGKIDQDLKSVQKKILQVSKNIKPVSPSKVSNQQNYPHHSQKQTKNINKRVSKFSFQIISSFSPRNNKMNIDFNNEIIRLNKEILQKDQTIEYLKNKLKETEKLLHYQAKVSKANDDKYTEEKKSRENFEKEIDELKRESMKLKNENNNLKKDNTELSRINFQSKSNSNIHYQSFNSNRFEKKQSYSPKNRTIDCISTDLNSNYSSLNSYECKYGKYSRYHDKKTINNTYDNIQYPKPYHQIKFDYSQYLKDEKRNESVEEQKENNTESIPKKEITTLYSRYNKGTGIIKQNNNCNKTVCSINTLSKAKMVNTFKRYSRGNSFNKECDKSQDRPQMIRRYALNDSCQGMTDSMKVTEDEKIQISKLYGLNETKNPNESIRILEGEKTPTIRNITPKDSDRKNREEAITPTTKCLTRNESQKTNPPIKIIDEEDKTIQELNVKEIKILGFNDKIERNDSRKNTNKTFIKKSEKNEDKIQSLIKKITELSAVAINKKSELSRSRSELERLRRENKAIKEEKLNSLLHEKDVEFQYIPKSKEKKETPEDYFLITNQSITHDPNAKKMNWFSKLKVTKTSMEKKISKLELSQSGAEKLIFGVNDRETIAAYDQSQRNVQLISLTEASSDFKENFNEKNSLCCNVNPSSFYVITGENTDILYKFDEESQEMIRVNKLNHNHTLGGLIYYNKEEDENEKLICLSGVYNKKVEVLDLKSTGKEWKVSEDMLIERSQCSYMILNNEYIFVFFGFNVPQNKYLNTIEYCDIETMKWKTIKDVVNRDLLSLSIKGHFMFNIKDKKNNQRFVILGGYDGQSTKPVENYIEVLIGQKNKDFSVEIKSTDRKLFGIGKNKIYLFNEDCFGKYNDFNEVGIFDQENRMHVINRNNLLHDIFYFQ